MYKLFCICVIFYLASGADAKLTADDCKVKEDTACTAEFGAPVSKPHHGRFVWDWDQQKCKAILWAYDCPHPENANNFGTRDECNDNCSGWA